MMTTRQLCLVALATSVAMGPRLAAQVQTELPPVVPGAKPVTVERVKVRGTALEGNLKRNAVELAHRFQDHVLRFFSQSLQSPGASR